LSLPSRQTDVGLTSVRRRFDIRMTLVWHCNWNKQRRWLMISNRRLLMMSNWHQLMMSIWRLHILLLSLLFLF